MKQAKKLVNTTFALLTTALATGFSTNASGKDFSVNGGGHLDLSTSCAVSIAPSQDGKISVEIDGKPQDAKKFDVEQQGDTVSVKETGKACSIVVNNSISVSNSDGISIINTNGRIFVNGKEIKTDDEARGQDQLSSKLPRVVIKAPMGGDLDAKLSASSSLTSSVVHNNANLDLSGSTYVNLETNELNIDAYGQTNVTATVHGGTLTVGISGQGDVKAKGTFENVKAELSGMGSFTTTGTVKGNYTAVATGMGKIVHRGQIMGRTSQNSNGMAIINLGD